jgi:hypothetical protein
MPKPVDTSEMSKRAVTNATFAASDDLLFIANMYKFLFKPAEIEGLRTFEDSIRDRTDREYGAIIDHRGTHLHDYKGKSREIPVKDYHQFLYLDTNFAHNHVSPWGFSPNDLRLACWGHLKSMRCVTPVYTYIMMMPNARYDLWDMDTFEKFNGLYNARKDSYIKRIPEYSPIGQNYENWRRYPRGAYAKSLTREQKDSMACEAQESLNNELWFDICRELGIWYMRISRPDMLKLCEPSTNNVLKDGV